MDERYDPRTGDPDWGDLRDWEGMDIYDTAGEKIGEVDDVYYDEQTQRPEWVSVGVGWFGSTRLIPVVGLRRSADGLTMPYTRDQVKDSPGISGDTVSMDEERELYSHYGLDYSAEASASQLPAEAAMGTTAAGEMGAAREPSEVATDRADMDRLEMERRLEGERQLERQRQIERERRAMEPHEVSGAGVEAPMTGSTERPVGRPTQLVRLRKRIVTEPVQVTIPVEREEVVVEPEPVSENAEDTTRERSEEELRRERIDVEREDPEQRVA